MVSMGPEGLEIKYFQETYSERNRVERWFRRLKERTRRFHNNMNSKKVGTIVEIEKAIELTYNLMVRTGIEGGDYIVDSTPGIWSNFLL